MGSQEKTNTAFPRRTSLRLTSILYNLRDGTCQAVPGLTVTIHGYQTRYHRRNLKSHDRRDTESAILKDLA